MNFNVSLEKQGLENHLLSINYLFLRVIQHMELLSRGQLLAHTLIQDTVLAKTLQ